METLCRSKRPGRTKEAAVELANLYTREAVRFTQQLQARAAGEVLQFVTPATHKHRRRHRRIEEQGAAQTQIDASGNSASTFTNQMKLQAAREELVEALTKYMDSHPVVQAARAKVEALQTQVTNSPCASRSAFGSRSRGPICPAT
jgi:hypothetical protein